MDIVLDAPIALGPYAMQDEASPLYVDGARVRMPFAEAVIVWSLLKAYPEMVSTGVLKERMGSDADSNVVSVHVCRLRAKLKALGVAPIENIHSRGYRWRP